jgi:uncharacterized protein YggE
MKANLLFLALLIVAAPLQAQLLPRPATPAPPIVTVQGRGEVRVPNTVATVTLGFEAAGSEEAPMIASERALKKCPSPEDTSLPPLMGAIPLALGNE